MLTADELKRYSYFSGLSDGSLEDLAQKLGTVHFKSGEKIIRQDSPPDYFYFLKQGEVEVKKRSRFGQDAKVTTLKSGAGFGETALLTCSHRQTSVIAKTDVTLYRLSKRDFEDIMLKESTFKCMLQKKAEDYATYNRMKLFQPFALLEPEKMLAIAEKLVEKTYNAGENILKQGDKPDYYYIIKSGRVAVLREKPGKEPEQIAMLGEGQSFGEEAIIREQGRNATVQAIEDTTVLSLSAEDFNTLLKASFLDFAFPEDFPEEERGKFVFIDARIHPEYEEEHIEGAVNIPIEVLRHNYRELDPSQEYLTYCTNDSRGMAAAFLLSTQGFKARNLRGGLGGWEGTTTTGPSGGVHLPKKH